MGVLERIQAAVGDRYRVEKEIGAGGMATVYLATDLKHHRSVAVKVLRPELAAALGHERFLREIEIAARLQHPHILPVYDSGEAGGLLFYVMPYVEGETLRDRLVRTGPLPPAEAARIAREAADALAYAHRQGIVHRDIKPANILISQGHAMVADFGIARAVTASAATQGLTQAGMAVGTPSYMSPEQALGEVNLDGRADIYALGVVLYEMLAGNPPFEGTTPQAIIAQALSRKVPKLVQDPLDLQPLIERALAREPQDRFQTSEELSAALDGLASGTGFRAGAQRRRTRGLVVAAGLATVAILGVVLWPRVFGAEEDPRKSLIVFPFENRTGDPSRDYLGEAAMNLLGLAASHWQDMRVYDDERTASLMRRRDVDAAADLDFEAARAMAREAKVGTLVVGDVRREGDSLALEAKVHDVRSGDRLATHIVRVPWEADPRPVFDRLAAQILGTSGAPPGERPSVLAQTTSSIEAYRAYLEGTAALQRFQIDTAKRLLQRAVALDSGFALAYLRLRDAEGWTQGTAGGSPASRRAYVLAAERHSASLPPRLKSLVEFHRAYEDNDFRRARRIASQMIARDSTDVEAWYQLGEAHFHHMAQTFSSAQSPPHADTVGNIGLALGAFQKTLELDSTYVLAYQHILDALLGCTNSNVWVCTADSAVYGLPEQLEARFGAATVQQLRDEARAAQVATARGWVAAVPGTPRARLALVQVLYNQRRYDEAAAEADAMDRLGWGAQAGAWKGMIEFLRGRPGDGAAALDRALAGVTDTMSLLIGQQNFGVPMAILAGGGGRVDAGQAVARSIFGKLPVDSANGPGGLLMSSAELRRLTEGYLLSEAGLPASAAVDADLRRMMERRAARDSAELRRLVTSFGSASLATFLARRDTTRLTAFLALADTTSSATWKVADAQLALARGDTARARMRVDRHYRTPTDVEFSGDQGVIRAFAWGDLLARLGDPRLALEAYARMDSSEARVQHPGFLVRSWAERGALYQRMGQAPLAIEHYERFIEAWRDADAQLQPLVDRARNAVAALKGEVAPNRR
jgi:tRNA A-37 threonylcarbamoyl transferase component Bud32/tetratricopeptide (TPR) repeat protein